MDYAKQVLSGYRLVDGIYPSAGSTTTTSPANILTSSQPSQLTQPLVSRSSVVGDSESINQPQLLNSKGIKTSVAPSGGSVSSAPSSQHLRAGSLQPNGQHIPVLSNISYRPQKIVRRSRSVSPQSVSSRVRQQNADLVGVRERDSSGTSEPTESRGSIKLKNSSKPRATSVGRAGVGSETNPILNGSAQFAVPKKDGQPHHLASTAASISHQFDFVPAHRYFDSYHAMGSKGSGNSFCFHLPVTAAAGDDLSLLGVSRISKRGGRSANGVDLVGQGDGSPELSRGHSMTSDDGTCSISEGYVAACLS